MIANLAYAAMMSASALSPTSANAIRMLSAPPMRVMSTGTGTARSAKLAVVVIVRANGIMVMVTRALLGIVSMTPNALLRRGRSTAMVNVFDHHDPLDLNIEDD